MICAIKKLTFFIFALLGIINTHAATRRAHDFFKANKGKLGLAAAGAAGATGLWYLLEKSKQNGRKSPLIEKQAQHSTAQLNKSTTQNPIKTEERTEKQKPQQNPEQEKDFILQLGEIAPNQPSPEELAQKRQRTIKQKLMKRVDTIDAAEKKIQADIKKGTERLTLQHVKKMSAKELKWSEKHKSEIANLLKNLENTDKEIKNLEQKLGYSWKMWSAEWDRKKDPEFQETYWANIQLKEKLDEKIKQIQKTIDTHKLREASEDLQKLTGPDNTIQDQANRLNRDHDLGWTVINNKERELRGGMFSNRLSANKWLDSYSYKNELRNPILNKRLFEEAHRDFQALDGLRKLFQEKLDTQENIKRHSAAFTKAIQEKMNALDALQKKIENGAVDELVQHVKKHIDPAMHELRKLLTHIEIKLEQAVEKYAPQQLQKHPELLRRLYRFSASHFSDRYKNKNDWEDQEENAHYPLLRYVASTESFFGKGNKVQLQYWMEKYFPLLLNNKSLIPDKHSIKKDAHQILRTHYMQKAAAHKPKSSLRHRSERPNQNQSHHKESYNKNYQEIVTIWDKIIQNHAEELADYFIVNTISDLIKYFPYASSLGNYRRDLTPNYRTALLYKNLISAYSNGSFEVKTDYRGSQATSLKEVLFSSEDTDYCYIDPYFKTIKELIFNYVDIKFPRSMTNNLGPIEKSLDEIHKKIEKKYESTPDEDQKKINEFTGKQAKKGIHKLVGEIFVDNPMSMDRFNTLENGFDQQVQELEKRVAKREFKTGEELRTAIIAILERFTQIFPENTLLQAELAKWIVHDPDQIQV